MLVWNIRPQQDKVSVSERKKVTMTLQPPLHGWNMQPLSNCTTRAIINVQLVFLNHASSMALCMLMSVCWLVLVYSVKYINI